MGLTSNAPSTAILINADNNGTIHANKNQQHPQQTPPPKNNFWIGTLVGGVTAVTVTTAAVAGYVFFTIRKQPNSSTIHNMSAAAVVDFERFSWGWWRHGLSTIISPTSITSVDATLQLQQQQREAAAAAAAAEVTTTNIVNTSVQTAIEQFQKELQTQLVHDRNQSTIQFLNTMQQQERTLTQTLGQPIHSTKEQMTNLQQQIQTLQQIFMSPKSRGTFGEVQLELLIKDVLPATMYTMQYTLSNKKRVDCMLHLPSPIGNIPIDSKFPTLTTNVTTTCTTNSIHTSTDTETSAANTTLPSSSAKSQHEQQSLRKKEIRDKLQKHINDIASKYILPGETSPHAICFIPSASLFLDIVTDHSDILLYAHRQNVWLTCPTTLLAVLTSIQGISRGQVVAQQTTNIFALITKLNKDIDLLVQRFEMAEKSVERTRTELTKMQTSVHKIQKVKMELDTLSQTVSIPILKPSPQQKHTSYDDNIRIEASDTIQSSVETLDDDAATGIGTDTRSSSDDSIGVGELHVNGDNETAPRISNV